MAKRIVKPNHTSRQSQNLKDNFILKVMEKEFGYTAAHSIISHVSRTTMKSKTEILSDYDIFSNSMKQVYTKEVAEKEILYRLSTFGMRQKM